MSHHDWADRKNEVVILGAGFSRAISEAMPLADELGIMIVNELAEEVGRYLGTNGFGPDRSFESWLSLLANEVPYLGETDNLRLRACFSAVRDAIGRILVQREQQVGSRWPDWLVGLLSVWARREATVITFNYDTLVERARTAYLAPDDPAYSAPLDLSVLARPLHDPVPENFALLKLHGSVNWWRVPGDLSDATLWEEPIREASGGARENRDHRRDDLSRERFLIPPLLAKSSWFSSPRIHHLWRQAYEALRAANRITLIGYSLPAADWVSVEMLDAALRDHCDHVQVEVVNLDSELHERLEKLASDQAEVVHCEQVSTYAERVISEEAERVVQDLDDSWPRHRPSDTVYVHVGRSVHQAVRAVSAYSQSGKELVFEVQPGTPWQGPGINSGELIASLTGCDRIAVVSSQKRFVVTDACVARPGQGDLWYLNLVAPALSADHDQAH